MLKGYNRDMYLKEEGENLYKSEGFLWLPRERYEYNQKTQRHEPSGEYYISMNPHCPKCLAELTNRGGSLYCDICKKEHILKEGLMIIAERVQKKWHASKLQKRTIISLDLLPTHIKDQDEDDNFWIEAKLGEKDGKRAAVVYFGEKTKDQTKKDYVQLFVDFDDEQIRSDKSNKNPIKLLGKLTAEFKDSKTTIEESKNPLNH